MVGVGSYAYVYGPSSIPTEQIGPNGSILYYLYDRQGSTVALTDSSGHVVARYAYTPYGSLTCGLFTHPGTSPNSPPCHPLPPEPPAACPSPCSHSPVGPPPCLARAIQANHFLYDGQYQDTISGLYYLRARWYDPATGQFTSVDALVAITAQPYSYAGGDPANAADILGLQTTLWLPSSLQQYESQWTPEATLVAGMSAPGQLFPIYNVWIVASRYWAQVVGQEITMLYNNYYNDWRANTTSQQTAQAFTTLCNAVNSAIQTLAQLMWMNVGPAPGSPSGTTGPFWTAAQSWGGVSALAYSTTDWFAQYLQYVLGGSGSGEGPGGIELIRAILPPTLLSMRESLTSGNAEEIAIDLAIELAIDSLE